MKDEHWNNEMVSVIMPAYNSEKYILESIESVQLQTYDDWELILIDDGSTDNTKNIIESIKTSKIRYFAFPESRGVAEARNAGIQRAKGRYIAFLDSDDIWLPEKLEHQLDFMRQKKISFSYSHYRHFIGKIDCCTSEIKTRDSVGYQDLLRGNDIGCLTVIIDRKAYPNIKMSLNKHEDYVTWLNLLRTGGRAFALHEDLARHRVGRRGSLTGNKILSAKWTWDVYRKSQKISRKMSAYYMLHYLLNGIRKHI